MKGAIKALKTLERKQFFDNCNFKPKSGVGKVVFKKIVFLSRVLKEILITNHPYEILNFVEVVVSSLITPSCLKAAFMF